jgi:hypothetical protein
MKQQNLEDDDMREEYDFSNSVRAPYAALAGDIHIAEIDPDVHAVFPDSYAVNEALRLLIKTVKDAQQLAKAS